jgi:hypothetical protein
MTNAFDRVQKDRELKARTGTSQIEVAYALMRRRVEERLIQARNWLTSKEGITTLARKKYYGMFCYVSPDGIAGYGRTVAEASRMVQRNTHHDPTNLIGLVVS